MMTLTAFKLMMMTTTTTIGRSGRYHSFWKEIIWWTKHSHCPWCQSDSWECDASNMHTTWPLALWLAHTEVLLLGLAERAILDSVDSDRRGKLDEPGSEKSFRKLKLNWVWGEWLALDSTIKFAYNFRIPLSDDFLHGEYHSSGNGPWTGGSSSKLLQMFFRMNKRFASPLNRYLLVILILIRLWLNHFHWSIQLQFSFQLTDLRLQIISFIQQFLQFTGGISSSSIRSRFPNGLALGQVFIFLFSDAQTLSQSNRFSMLIL